MKLMTREGAEALLKQARDTDNLLGNPPRIEVYASTFIQLVEEWLEMESELQKKPSDILPHSEPAK